ncbi:MBL fold metallo-hydrolase [Undibacterium sp. TS12]|uniref:MBL fold metallo-hydrolase n=1 Tax=Undibacterium sp. TS12 TaxID=2908202 RepID=UPI001F4C7FE9|nr:MBL fold metallo-hydrolase [Undibacterium sp. TS12]MCH8622407.1 MBL fold metallo-hydrolase [Undibacterium sp. TS12]
MKITTPLKAARLITATALLSLGTLNAFAAAPMVNTPAPGFSRFMLGNFEVTALSDGTVDLPVDKLLHQSASKTLAALDKAFLKAPAETSVNAYLINTGKRLVLIDAGTGTLFGPTLGKLVNNLKASGYQPEDIDDVFLTHLHPDHAGGIFINNAIQFKNAVIHAEKHEADFWLSQKNMDNAPAASKSFFQGAMQSIQPYMQNQRFAAFEGNIELTPGVSSYASTGHTAGHTSYLVESEGKKLLLVGDLIHVPAVQLEHPEVTIDFDSDAQAAKATRLKLFSAVAKDGTLIAATHIPFPGVGHLRSNGKTYTWVPLNYTQMR